MEDVSEASWAARVNSGTMSQLNQQIYRCSEVVFSHVPNDKVAEIARMLKVIHAQEYRKAAQTGAAEIVSRLKAMKLKTAVELIEQKDSKTLDYYSYPPTHRGRFAPVTYLRASSGSGVRIGSRTTDSIH